MADYRDPKVTNTGKSSDSKMKWVWIALAIILLLLLLWWFFGGTDETAEVETTAPAVVVEEPEAEVVPDVEAVDPEPDLDNIEAVDPEPDLDDVTVPDAGETDVDAVIIEPEAGETEVLEPAQ